VGDSFFDVELHEFNPFSFGRAVERLLWHLGFTSVSYVDGQGDGGADLVALYQGDRWVFQIKSKSRSSVEPDAVGELIHGMQRYHANRGAVVTNGRFSRAAVQRAGEVEANTGLKVGLWGRSDLLSLVSDGSTTLRFSNPDLRSYQTEAFMVAKQDLTNVAVTFGTAATDITSYVASVNI
jgi:hypothetical protein